MNPSLKQSSIIIALVSMILLYLSALPLKGVWVLRLFAQSLLFFWIGCILFSLKPVNKKIKLAVALALAVFIAINLCGARFSNFISFFGVTVLLRKTLWLCLTWLVLGWLMQPKAVIGEKNPEDSFVSYLLLFLTFAVFHVWFLWSSQHLYSFRYAPVFTLDASPFLFPAGLYLSFVAQFAAVLYGVKLLQHPKVSSMISKISAQTMKKG